MAQAILVSRLPTNVILPANQCPVLYNSLDPDEWQSPASQSQSTWSHSLIFWWVSTLELSCSEFVQTILNSQKHSARKCYLAKWKCFFYLGPAKIISFQRSWIFPLFYSVSLCLRHQVFFFSSLKFYLAAVSACPPPLDGYLTFTHSVTTRFLKGLIRTFLPVKKPSPHWELNFVLSALRRSPSEHSLCISWLTYQWRSPLSLPSPCPEGWVNLGP